MASYNILDHEHDHELSWDPTTGLLLAFYHDWNQYHLICYLRNKKVLMEECYRLILAGISG